MGFQPVKRNIMQITRKRNKKTSASYTLEGTVLGNVEKMKYLGITNTKDLKWNTHRYICTKANRTLGFPIRKLVACPQDVKESAYKRLTRTVQEYRSSVWDLKSIYFLKMNLRRRGKGQLDL